MCSSALAWCCHTAEADAAGLSLYTAGIRAHFIGYMLHTLLWAVLIGSLLMLANEEKNTQPNIKQAGRRQEASLSLYCLHVHKPPQERDVQDVYGTGHVR